MRVHGRGLNICSSARRGRTLRSCSARCRVLPCSVRGRGLVDVDAPGVDVRRCEVAGREHAGWDEDQQEAMGSRGWDGMGGWVDG